MKKLIQWLAKVFNANITKEVIVEREKIITKEVFVSLDKDINGSVTIAGDLVVKGYLFVNGEVTCDKIKGE